MSTSRDSRADNDRVEANLTGAYITIAGVVIFVISIFLDWASSEEDEEAGEAAGEAAAGVFSAYEADSLWPFAAFLGIGFAVALMYAASRAYRNQHRGLSLASMAVGLAVTLQVLAWILDVPGAAERADQLNEDAGAYLGLLGAAIWTIGSGILAKEPEGDDHDHDRDARRR